MPGRHTIDQQYKYYLGLRGTGMTQVRAGFKAGLSERMGRRLETLGRPALTSLADPKGPV